MNQNNTYIVLDTETTGLSVYNGDAIIEIAAVKLQNNEIIETFNELINPRVPISPYASRVHGMDNAFIAQNGRKTIDVFPELLQFIKNAPIVGHNIVRFDMPFINKHLSDLDINPLENEVIDTLHLARKHLSLPNYKLSTLANHYNVTSHQVTHRALDDTMVTAQVFLKLLNH